MSPLRTAAMAFALHALVGLVTLVTLVTPGVARACGGSGPGGTGMCTLPTGGPREARRDEVRVGTSLAVTDTTILFGGGRRADMKRTAAFASLALPVTKAMAFEASLGGFLAGELRTPAGRVELGPGLVTALGLAVRAVDGKGSAPLVLVSATLSSTQARGDDARHVQAYDLRATVMVGKTVLDVLTPYVLGRAFGGPVWFRWDDGTRVQGTDLYKYQVGAGLSLALRPVDLFVEAAPLGERNLAAGLGVRF